MSDDILHEIYNRVIKTQTMVETLVTNDSDKEKRLRSLEGSRNKVYGFLGVGVLASFAANIENFIDSIKRMLP